MCKKSSRAGEHPEHVKEERLSLVGAPLLNVEVPPLPSLPPASDVKATRSAHSHVRSCSCAGSFASGQRSGAHFCAGEGGALMTASSALPLRLSGHALPCLVS